MEKMIVIFSGLLDFPHFWFPKFVGLLIEASETEGAFRFGRGGVLPIDAM